MVVGVPREIKVGEQRVALTPAGARAFSEAGHPVLVETGAGAGSGFRDEEYTQAGAETGDVSAVWSRSELVLKVKEPLAEEIPRIREGQTLFTYLHLAPVPDLVRALQARGVLAIAYETVERADGSLPLLTPMSEVAGRLAVQEGEARQDAVRESRDGVLFVNHERPTERARGEPAGPGDEAAETERTSQAVHRGPEHNCG